jgi:alkylhydroperoxidase family enzyme
MSEGRGRIAPLLPEHWTDEVRDIFGWDPSSATADAVAPDAPKPPNILLTIAHHPSLLRPFLGFASALAGHGVLSKRVAELLALRTAWNCASDFEWGHHVRYARAAGLDDAEIARVPHGPDAPGWSDEDRTLLRAADELHDAQMIRSETWDELSSRWNPSELVELCFVVGNYTMLSMVAKATGVPVERRLARLPRLDGNPADDG